MLMLSKATFYAVLVLVGICSVFWLFRLSCKYLPSDWLERLLRGSLSVTRGLSPQSLGRRVFMIFLVQCIVSFFYNAYFCTPALHNMSHTSMARYCLSVLKMPLHTKY